MLPPKTLEKKTSSDLFIKKLQLHWLLQVTKAINYNLPSDQLFEVYETVMRDHLKVRKLALYVHEGQWNQKLSYGLSEEIILDDPDIRFAELSSMEFNNMQMPSWVEGFESIIPVFHNHPQILILPM